MAIHYIYTPVFGVAAFPPGDFPQARVTSTYTALGDWGTNIGADVGGPDDSRTTASDWQLHLVE